MILVDWQKLRRTQHLWPYLVTAVLLFILLAGGEKLWMTNDDVRMSMTVGGYGIVAVPSPGLGMGMMLQTSVIWGWLLMHVPDVAHIRGYTVATYFLLLTTAVVIGAALYARKVPGWFAAAALAAIYGSVLLVPQFTLLAGYLAVAGLALVLASDEHNLKLCLPVSGVLLVLSGLVRPDELALVGFVSSPLLLHAWLTRSWRWRLHWLGLAALCVLMLAVAFVVNQRYNSGGGWAAFVAMDQLRGQFIDYGLAHDFIAHPRKLAGSGVSVIDMMLMHSWFYLDPQVYNPTNFAPLLHSVTVMDRFQLNFGRTASIIKVFETPEFVMLLALFALFALLDWRRILPEVVAVVFMLLFMEAITLWGRPGVERVYQPVAAALLVLTLLKLGPRQGRWVVPLGLAAFAMALALVVNVWQDVSYHAGQAAKARTATCAGLAPLPKDQLLLVWTGHGQYRWKDIYRPTIRDDDACNRPIYAIGTYQLAPPSLEQLYRYTGGRNLVQALLAGQQFYIITSEGRLTILDRYLQAHYHVSLTWQRQPTNRYYFQMFTIQTSPVTPQAAGS